MSVVLLERSRLERRARLLAWFTVAWNALEGVIAVWAGVAAGSLALVGFGLDSFVEVFAAGVVLWHLKGAMRPASSELYASSPSVSLPSLPMSWPRVRAISSRPPKQANRRSGLCSPPSRCW